MSRRLILQTVITSAIDLIPQGGGSLKLIHAHGPQGALHEIRLSRKQALDLASALNLYAEDPANADTSDRG